MHGERHPELAFAKASFDELALELDPHLAREERILFSDDPPARLDRRPPRDARQLADPIRVMLSSTTGPESYWSGLRGLTDGYRTP